jgi:hypothetical protein
VNALLVIAYLFVACVLFAFAIFTRRIFGSFYGWLVKVAPNRVTRQLMEAHLRANAPGPSGPFFLSSIVGIMCVVALIYGAYDLFIRH